MYVCTLLDLIVALSYIYEVFEKAGVTHQTSEVLMGQCEKAISLLSMSEYVCWKVSALLHCTPHIGYQLSVV